MAKNVKGREVSKAQETAMINNEIDTREPNLLQLKHSVEKGKQQIKFLRAEVELLKGKPVDAFKPTQGYGYQLDEDYCTFFKELKIETLELQANQLEESFKKTNESYELESAIMRILKEGKTYYGMTDEEILQH